MAIDLIEFKENEDILASAMNANFGKIADHVVANNEQLTTYVESKLTSLQSNITSVQSSLQNNIDKKLDKTTFANIAAYIKERGGSGTNWYRIWSDNWCEQGGRVDTGTNTTKSVFLTKPYRDTNYTINLDLYSPGSGGDKHPLYINAINTSNFSIRNTNSNGQVAFWRTAGFIS